MCLLNLVEQHHRVWLAAHRLGQLSALVIAHISWRRTDKAAHAELLLILRHVYSRHHLLVVEQILGKSLRQFGLSHTCRSHEDERCDGSFRVLQSCTAAAHGIADGGYRLVLSDDTAVQLLLQMQQFLALALQHSCHRDACPAAHHLGNVVGGHLLAHHTAAFTLCQLLCQAVDVVLKSLQPAVPYLCHPCVVALALGTFCLELQLFHLLLVLLNLVHQTLLALPFSTELVLALTQFGNVLVQLRQFSLVVLALYSLAFNLQLLQLSHDVVKFLRNRIALHAQFRCGLVHQVDCLVGQEPVADVTLREFHRCYAGIILDTHLVVVLITLLQSAQYAYCRHLVRLVNHHRLETALQSLVLLEILLVLVKSGGTYRAQFATRKSRFQNVRCVHSTLSAAGTHQGVNLIDEEDYASVALCHLVDDALQSLLKLTFILRSCEQGTHVEAVELLVLKVLRHVTAHDTLCQSLHDGRLTRSRLSYEHRIVLCPSRENLQHASDLVVTSYHRVQFSGARILHQVLGIL